MSKYFGRNNQILACADKKNQRGDKVSSFEIHVHNCVC